MERGIKKALAVGRAVWWETARRLHEFHEEQGWKPLGHDTIEDWLAQPEIGLSRSFFFRAVQTWRDLVEVKEVAPARLKEVEPSKAHEVLPAVMRGDVEPEAALDDAKALGKRDLREKYRPSRIAKHGHKPDDSTPLDASTEPKRVKCPTCDQWADADVIEGTAREKPSTTRKRAA